MMPTPKRKTAMFAREAFERKYGGQKFDMDNRLDAMAEAARQKVCETFLQAMEEDAPQTAEETQYLVAGMMIGICCVAASIAGDSDRDHAMVRSGIIEMTPWAVDMMRQILDLPPLSDGN